MREEQERLRQDLQALGVKAGDILMVHSSMKALGTGLTPDEVIDALEVALGEEGTLLMPALTYENVTAAHPVFDSKTAEPCVGLLPQTFFRRPGVERSIHPTHSAAASGKLTHLLTVGHQMDDVAVGPHSPFMLLPVYGGKLLFIGDILHACTFMHGIEEIVHPPFLRRVQQAFVVNSEERLYWGNDNFGWGAEFQRIADILEEPDMKRGQLLAAPSYLIDSRALLAAGLARMRAEPYYFVTDISRWI